MSRVLHALEKGIRITGENADLGVDMLFGANQPSDADTDAAEVGSIYMRTNGELWQKKTAGTGVDKWERKAALSDLTSISFRGELIRAATGDTAPTTGSVIDLAANPFSDDQAPLLTAASFSVNDHIIFGVGATEKLMRVSVVSLPNITVVDAAAPLAANDNFVVQNYLPDSPADQESQALVHYDGSSIIKLADFNWSLATGISLSGAFSAIVGVVAGGDSVESAIAKLEGSLAALVTLSGVARGDANLGSFTGDIIPDGVAIKPALQSLETHIQTNGRTQASAVTTIVTLDSVLVDNVKASKWYVMARKTSNPSQVKAFEIFALHNGTPAADATLVDDTEYAKLKKGASFDLEVSVDLNGTGAAQTMRLRALSAEAGGVDIFAFREDVK